MKISAVTAALAALTALLAVSCVGEDDGDRLKTGSRIPSFTVDGPSGTFSSGSLTDTGGVLVFFASYCPTCHQVMPEIEKLWKASSGGKLFAVAPLSRQGVAGESESDVEEYWADEGFTMPYYLDRDGAVYYMFAKKTVPRIYVIDREGKISFASSGDGSIKAGRIADQLEKALGITVEL